MAMRRDIMVMAVDTRRPTTAATTRPAIPAVTRQLTMAADTGPTMAGRMSAACIVQRTTVATGTAGDRAYERAAEYGGPFLELHNKSRQSISCATTRGAGSASMTRYPEQT